MNGIRYRLTSRTGPINVEDYRRRARRALPDMIWAYVDGGSEDQVTLRRNRAAFERWALRGRVLTGKEPDDLRVDVGGATIDLPVLLAPTGLTGLVHAQGELGAARAAERVGTRAIISTAATYTLEEIAEGTSEDHFFQLYPWADVASGGRELSRQLMARAVKSGFGALFLTVDVQTHSNREQEKKRGMGVPPVLTPRRILDAAIRPRWWWYFLRQQRMSARLLVDERGPRAAMRSAEVQYRLTRPDLSWDDFRWIRDTWEGPLYIKGVLHPDDAERAVALGADGIVVSNHGGRQLDGTVASIDALPAIADRVAGRAQILLDSGVRRGSDVIKALCLGASAVCIGRPYVYGLAADGADGVAHVLEILRDEILRTMTLMGVGSLAELDRSKIEATPALPPGLP